MLAECLSEKTEKIATLEAGVQLESLSSGGIAFIDGAKHFITYRDGNMMQTIFREDSGDIVTTLMIAHRKQNPQGMEYLVFSRVDKDSEDHYEMDSILQEVGI